MLTRVKTADHQEICLEDLGAQGPTLLFLHGWLGNRTWWDAQKSAFGDHFRVITMDLVGHGDSTKTRSKWSIESFAQDVLTVIETLHLQDVTLVAHSMSGSIAFLASAQSAAIRKVVLVDTLQHIGKMPTMAEVAPLFEGLRQNYQATISGMVPNYMFNAGTPDDVRERLMSEFLAADPRRAADMLQPLYETNIEAAARTLTIPVRAIQSDKWPTDVDMNRGYVKDYDCSYIAGVGHYPMLEAPAEFNKALGHFVGKILK